LELSPRYDINNQKKEMSLQVTEPKAKEKGVFTSIDNVEIDLV